MILHVAWATMLIYCRYEAVIAQLNITFQGDGSRDRFIKCFKPRRKYRGADKSLARPTSRCILFDGENISFDASLVLYIYIYVCVCVCVCVCK